ncbi:MAG: ribose 5-phosphate isomerase B [Pirellulaceae bacterium]|nr:ribose 5-phosphate isomerase B [Pirellulaceae bacterium]
MASDIIAVASDHAGFAFKESVKELLEDMGCTVLDLGAHSEQSVDYPDFADALAQALDDGRASRGIAICGTGTGIAMAANRHRNVRAAVCHSTTEARLARQHNDANVIAFGARTMGMETIVDSMKTFLETEFEGGRHVSRVAKFS